MRQLIRSKTNTWNTTFQKIRGIFSFIKSDIENKQNPTGSKHDFKSEPSNSILIDTKYHQEFEQAFDSLLNQDLKNPCFIEIGNSWGYLSMSFLNAHPNSNCIIADPDAHFLNITQKNLELNNQSAEYIRTSFGSAIKKEALFEDWQGELKVCEIDTLDNFMSSRNLDKIDLLIFDIQNQELEFLHGAENALSERQLRNIMLSTYSSVTHKACKILLQNKGYEIMNSYLPKYFSKENGLIVACASI